LEVSVASDSRGFTCKAYSAKKLIFNFIDYVVFSLLIFVVVLGFLL